MSTPAPSPPLPAWNPARIVPLAGHCQVMPPTLRVAPGDGVGAVAAGGAACAGGGAVEPGATVAVIGAVADADSAGATPFALMVCVVTGPNTGCEGCVDAGCPGVGNGAFVIVLVVTTVVPAATGPAGGTDGVDDAFSFNTWPGRMV